mmetsp:Transcript_28301/g.68824  ORF Transcript_28301/g.68824 Transcript_28301/m.68824 type:complete len:306 (+) Transcript_28301:219-1136(+)
MQQPATPTARTPAAEIPAVEGMVQNEGGGLGGALGGLGGGGGLGGEDGGCGGGGEEGGEEGGVRGGDGELGGGSNGGSGGEAGGEGGEGGCGGGGGGGFRFFFPHGAGGGAGEPGDVRRLRRDEHAPHPLPRQAGVQGGEGDSAGGESRLREEISKRAVQVVHGGVPAVPQGGGGGGRRRAVGLLPRVRRRHQRQHRLLHECEGGVDHRRQAPVEDARDPPRRADQRLRRAGLRVAHAAAARGHQDQRRHAQARRAHRVRRRGHRAGRVLPHELERRIHLLPERGRPRRVLPALRDHHRVAPLHA